MPILQPIYKTGSRQRNQARNLIAGAQQPAPHVIAATEECDGYSNDVKVVPCKSKKLQVRCGITLIPGQRYWMVRSPRFNLRWYLVTKNIRTDAWMCSSREEQAAAYCIGQVRPIHEAARRALKASGVKPTPKACGELVDEFNVEELADLVAGRHEAC